VPRWRRTLGHVVAFLPGIGLPPRAAMVEGDTFLPGIRITRGELVSPSPEQRRSPPARHSTARCRCMRRAM
jgi:hypothetical protein